MRGREDIGEREQREREERGREENEERENERERERGASDKGEEGERGHVMGTEWGYQRRCIRWVREREIEGMGGGGGSYQRLCV